MKSDYFRAGRVSTAGDRTVYADIMPGLRCDTCDEAVAFGPGTLTPTEATMLRFFLDRHAGDYVLRECHFDGISARSETAE